MAEPRDDAGKGKRQKLKRRFSPEYYLCRRLLGVVTNLARSLGTLHTRPVTLCKWLTGLGAEVLQGTNNKGIDKTCQS